MSRSRNAASRRVPRLLALVCAFTLTFGADAPDFYKGMGWTKALWVHALHAAPTPAPAACQHVELWLATHTPADVQVVGALGRRRGRVTECSVMLHSPAGYGCDRFDVTGARAVLRGPVDCADPFATTA